MHRRAASSFCLAALTGAAGATLAACDSRPLMPGGAAVGEAARGSGGVSAGDIGGSGGAGGDASAGQDGAPPLAATGWTEISAPASAANLRVTDAWAAGPDDIYFAGAAPVSPESPTGAAKLLHVSHGAWTVEVVAVPAKKTWLRPSVGGTAPDDIWMVFATEVWHRDATGWSRLTDETWIAAVPRPAHASATAGPALTRIRAAARGDAWAVGVQDGDYTGGAGFILHRAAGAWGVTVLDQPNGQPPVYFEYSDISVGAPNDVWISGGSDQVGSTMDPAFIYHYDGAGWTPIGFGRYSLPALWPTGDGGLWLSAPSSLGLLGDGGGVVRITLARYRAGRFQAVDVAGLDPSSELTSLWGAAPDDVWAAGDDVAHWDGQSWRVAADAPDGARPRDQSHGTLVTGDPTSVWLIASGPRFWRLADVR